MTERPHTTTRKITDVILIGTFVAGLGLPFLGTFFGIDTGRLLDENRLPAPLPELRATRQSIYEFPGKFEAWLNDRFGFRNTFVGWHSYVKVKWMGMSSSRHVVIGEDGWLFYSAMGIIDDFCGEHPFTHDELLHWQRLLEERRDWLASRGIRYLFFVAPEKSSIYPEFLPEDVREKRGRTRLDQLVEHMKTHSDVEVLDLRRGLLEAKPQERLYHKTDTHWTDMGAFLAYRQVAERVAEVFPKAAPLERSDLTRSTYHTRGLDLAGMLGLKNDYEEEVVSYAPSRPGAQKGTLTELMQRRRWRPLREPEVWTSTRDGLPKSLVIHDSYMVQIKCYLSENFARTVYMWHHFDPEVIEAERPDIVIHEVTQRVLSCFTTDNPSENPPPVHGFRLTRSVRRGSTSDSTGRSTGSWPRAKSTGSPPRAAPRG